MSVLIENCNIDFNNNNNKLNENNNESNFDLNNNIKSNKINNDNTVSVVNYKNYDSFDNNINRLNKFKYHETKLYSKELDNIYNNLFVSSNKIKNIIKINEELKNDDNLDIISNIMNKGRKKQKKSRKKIKLEIDKTVATIKFLSSYNKKLPNILNKYLNTYNFVYKKKGEEANNKKTINTINTNRKRDSYSNLTSYEKTLLKRTLLSHIYNGYLHPDFIKFNKCNVLFDKKNSWRYNDESNKNSRCISNNDDKLKLYSKLIYNLFINPIFMSGLIDIKINSVKDCIVYTRNDEDGAIYENLSFKNIALLSKEIVSESDEFMLLDLTNAYNNVPFHTLYYILSKYLNKLNIFNSNENLNNHIKDTLITFNKKYKTVSKKNISKNNNNNINNQEDEENKEDVDYYDFDENKDNQIDIKFKSELLVLDNIFDYNEVDIDINYDYKDIELHENDMKYNQENNLMVHNLCIGIVELMKNIEYNDTKLGKKMRRNKGVPQGNSISRDIFVICMDYILKHVMKEFNNQLDLVYKKDYELKAYVDDIGIKFLTNKSINLSKKMFYIIKDVMSKYHFIINDSKTKCSNKIAQVSGFKNITPDDRYLGLYFENDRLKYLKLIELELKPKFIDLKNGEDKSYIFTFNNIENNIEKLTDFEKKSLRGKLQFRLTKFCNNRDERYEFMNSAGYPKIAKFLFG